MEAGMRASVLETQDDTRGGGSGVSLPQNELVQLSFMLEFSVPQEPVGRLPRNWTDFKLAVRCSSDGSYRCSRFEFDGCSWQRCGSVSRIRMRSVLQRPETVVIGVTISWVRSRSIDGGPERTCRNSWSPQSHRPECTAHVSIIIVLRSYHAQPMRANQKTRPCPKCTELPSREDVSLETGRHAGSADTIHRLKASQKHSIVPQLNV